MDDADVKLHLPLLMDPPPTLLMRDNIPHVIHTHIRGRSGIAEILVIHEVDYLPGLFELVKTGFRVGKSE